MSKAAPTPRVPWQAQMNEAVAEVIAEALVEAIEECKKERCPLTTHQAAVLLRKAIRDAPQTPVPEEGGA